MVNIMQKQSKFNNLKSFNEKKKTLEVKIARIAFIKIKFVIVVWSNFDFPYKALM